MENMVIDKGGGNATSFAKRVEESIKTNMDELKKLLDRNVISAKIKQGVRKPTLSNEMFENLCDKLLINIENDIEGY